MISREKILVTRDEKYRRTKARNLAYRTRRALKLIRLNQPKNLLETHQLGLTLIHTGGGAFRTSYRIKGTTLLVKFPVILDRPNGETNDFEGKNHTRMEVKKIRRLRKDRIMAGHMPPIYYFNARDGVLVTKFYKTVRDWRTVSGRNRLMSKLIKCLTGVVLDDILGDNVKIDGHDKLIFVDLGY